ncbi:MAG TPA: nucleotidyltransferase domain-containing protein [Stellaceae bacterium]|nr:nucleotidyltransferase domain-containing protein [Stellaceae bacterium]
MDKAEILAALRAHEAELREAGVERLAIFGSVARGDDAGASDVDVVVCLDPQAAAGGFAYFGRLDTLARRLSRIVGRPVDLVPEPVRKERLKRSIEKESVRAF